MVKTFWSNPIEMALNYIEMSGLHFIAAPWGVRAAANG